MATTQRVHTTADLIVRLDRAVLSADDEARCRQVSRVLSEVVRTGLELPPVFLRPAALGYARRLLHLDAERRYSVIVMVWDRDQGTMLHDHGGSWCVECVYRGRVRVTSYTVRGGDPETGIVQFAQAGELTAGVGETAALISPFEYHALRNASSSPAVTLHVCGGEVGACHVYEPVQGGWRRRYRELGYTA